MLYTVVTGASKGMGKAIVEQLLSCGCAVAVCGRNEKDLRDAVDIWRKTYEDSDIIWMAADMATAEGVNAFSELITNSFPQVDVLINNAGGYTPGNITEEQDTVLESMLAVNLWGPYRLCKALAPVMKMQQAGHIINICSIASLKGYAGIGSYSISKYALLGLTDNLREELRQYGVKVTAICPGATWTSSWEGSDMPQSRIMEATDIAMIVWSAINLSPQAVAETIVLRPQKGDV